jgi:flagellar hook-associated protein 2
MAGLTVSGLGSGLDVKGIVDSLVASERTRFEPKEAQASEVKTRLSAYGRIRTSLTNLQDVAKRLQTLANKVTRAETSDASLLQVNASNGASAANYEVTVNRSAQSSRFESQTLLASSVKPATGANNSVSVRMGGVDFKSANITDTDDLRAVADKINSAQAVDASGNPTGESLSSKGFKASVISVNGGVKLVFEGPTGAANDFAVTVNEGGGDEGLNASGSVTAADNTGLSQILFAGSDVQKARDASVSIKRNGLALTAEPITRPTNTFNDVPGMTNVSFSIRKAVDAPAEKPASLTVFTSPDNEGIKTALRDLVRETNATMASLKNNQKKGGQLESETTPVRLMSAIRTALGSAKEGLTLNSLGLSFSKEGTLSLDEARFNQAIQDDPLMAGKLFGDVNLTTSGIAKDLDEMIKATVGESGLLSTRTESLNRQSSAIDRDRTRFEESIARLRKRLTSQFAALDTTVANLQQSQGAVVQRLTALQQSGNGS